MSSQPHLADPMERFWHDDLAAADPEIAEAIGNELKRQQDKIELIASENIASRAVLEAAGSVFTNKYAEGYPGKRYYGGCEYADVVETLAIERAKRLFGCDFANVQPNSGSQMNQAVFLALLNPGDKFMGLDLNSGGHLTHGSPVNMSGKWFTPVPYGVRREDHRIDMAQVAALAREHRPKLIICGGTAYSRVWDFAAFRAIADEVGATLLADISHFSGLVAGGAHPSPFPHCHVVTTTTHKSLRGPRSGVILTNDEGLARKLNSAIFPGLQGGPLMHIVAAKAVAFAEALRSIRRSRTLRAQQVVDECPGAVLAETDQKRWLRHRHRRHRQSPDAGRPDGRRTLTGKAVRNRPRPRAGITCNKNGVPFDTRSPFVTSGIRLGTPAGTTRGFGPAEFREVGALIARVVDGLSRNGDEGDGQVEQHVRDAVAALTVRFPIYPEQ